MSETSASRHPSAVTAAELRDWLRSPDAPRVLDVRSPAEFESQHIAGSYNVPLETLREHRDELRRHLDEDVVLVCRSGVRAAQAELAFADAGMPNVHVLDGGIARWDADGGPLRRGRQRWDIERQVRLLAGTLVVGGVLGGLAAPPLTWLAGAVGAGLAAAALTDSCLMGQALARLPFNHTASACDIDTILARLSEPTAATGARP